MSNADFIAKYCFKQGILKQNGNLLLANGIIYSYGSHYPLLFKVNNIPFVNIAGYSNTTSKHIGIAWRYAKHGVIVPSGRYSSIKTSDVIDWLIQESNQLDLQLLNLKRKGTQKEQRLLSRNTEILEALQAIKNASK